MAQIGDLLKYEHDNRLDLLVDGEYRMWNDAYTTMVPKGMSTTKPLKPESVPANIDVYGEIQKGFFKQPLVDFTNCNMDRKRFDRYFLQTWRPGDDIPTDPDIDYPSDLGVSRIKTYERLLVRYLLVVDEFIPQAIREGDVSFYHIEGSGTDFWISDDLYATLPATQRAVINYCYVVNPPQNLQGTKIPTGQTLIQDKLPITMLIKSSKIIGGMSEFENDILNSPFNDTLGLYTVSFDIIGGGSNG